MTQDRKEGRDSVLETVLDEVRPDDAERTSLNEAYERVKERAEDALEEVGVEGEVELVGSTARDTWLSGDKDIDVFLLLPESLERDEFEEVGLDVGKEVFPDGEVEYAEHPYVKGHESGFDVDVVPCYDVDSAREARSAVDRTPFHNEYVQEASDGFGEGFGDEVRLLKTFARRAGVYGSDLRTRGFSGYLCELLVLDHGGFEDVVADASEWDRGEKIDIEGHASKEFDDPLVVIDPTDPERNVATVVSDDSFGAFIDWCRRWEREPSVDLFLADGTEDETVESLDESEFESLLRRRGTNLVCVVFKTPDVVDDQLYPQLRKTRRSLVDELGRLGFDVVRSREAATEDRCLVLVEMNVGEQSNVEKHAGPPVHVGEHAERFRSKYADSQVTGPYIEDGRYVVEREREFTTVGEFVRSEEFLEIGMGKHVGEKIEEGYEVIENGDCARLLDDFGTEFEDYFRPELGPR